MPERRPLGVRCYPALVLKRIAALAESDPDREVCGFVVERPGGAFDVVPVPNAADRYHEQDRSRFPRGARDSYLMDPLTQLRVLREAASGASGLVAIYHSHVDASANFSQRDREDAVVGGVQQIPGVEYLVVSVVRGAERERRRVVWDGRDFVDLPLYEPSGDLAGGASV